MLTRDVFKTGREEETEKVWKCEHVTKTFQTQNKMTAGSQEQGQGRKVVNLLGPIMSSLRCGFQSRWQVEWDCSIFLDRETVRAKFNMRKTMFVVTTSPGYCCFHEYWSYSQFIKAISYRRRQARMAQKKTEESTGIFFFSGRGNNSLIFIFQQRSAHQYDVS